MFRKVSVLTACIFALAAASPAPKEPPLVSAVLKNDLPTARHLLAAGVSADTQTNSNRLTVLNYAAANDKLAMVKLLVAHHATVDSRSSGGYTPLMYASGGGAHMPMVAFLLARGANPRAAARDGSTALHFASSYDGRPDVVTLLLEHGAAIDASDMNEERPLTIAASKKKSALVRVLLARGADGGYALPWASYKNDLGAVQTLLDAGVNVDARFTGRFGAFDGDTALMEAARQNNLEIAQLLISRGADPNVVEPGDSNMTTALMWAAFNCNADMIRLLSSHGANDNTKANDRNAYDLARTGWTGTMEPCSSDVLDALSAMQ